jgi:hypothetical protein
LLDKPITISIFYACFESPAISSYLIYVRSGWRHIPATELYAFSMNPRSLNVPLLLYHLWQTRTQNLTRKIPSRGHLRLVRSAKSRALLAHKWVRLGIASGTPVMRLVVVQDTTTRSSTEHRSESVYRDVHSNSIVYSSTIECSPSRIMKETAQRERNLVIL